MSPSADDEQGESPPEDGDSLIWGRDEGSVEAGIERFFLAGRQEGLTLGDAGADPSESLPTQDLQSVIENFAKDLGPKLGGRWEVPRRMGPYVLSHYVGHGGMGVVFKAVHDETGQSAAVKIVPESREDLVQALEREAASLANSRHPHIPDLFGSGRTGGYAWVASRWIDGESLADQLHERSTVREATPISSSTQPTTVSNGTGSTSPRRGRRRQKADRKELHRCVGWARDVARSLQTIHDEGRVHRDVKPANLVVDEDGKIWLIDFGLAERAHGDSDDPLRFHLAGTVPYMSPEQTWGGRVGVGPPSDVYALAITFHEVITGCRVVQSGGGGALREIALSDVPKLSDLVGGIPEDLDRVFQKATRKNPSERYLQAGQLASDLDDWLAGRTPRIAVAKAERGAILRDAVYLVVLLAFTAILSWKLAPTMAERRWAELEALMDSGRAEEVYDALVEEGADLTSQPGFRRLAEWAVEKVAPVRTRELILGWIQVAAYPGLTSLRATRAREARALLALPISPHPDLLAQVVYPQVFSSGEEKAKKALAALDRPRWREIAKTQPLLQELAATAQATMGNWEASQATLRGMTRKVPDDVHLVFEALRLKTIYFRGKRKAVIGGVDDTKLRQWMEVLGQELSRTHVPDALVSAHAILALALHELLPAIADFERMKAPWPPRNQEDLACHLQHAAALIGAGVDEGAKAHALARLGRMKARLLLDRFPLVGPILAKRIYLAPAEKQARLVPIFQDLYKGRRRILRKTLTQHSLMSVVDACYWGNDAPSGEAMYRLMESVWPDLEPKARYYFFQATVYVAAMETEYSDGLDRPTRLSRYEDALHILSRIPDDHPNFAWEKRFQTFQARVRIWTMKPSPKEEEKVRLIEIADELGGLIDQNVEDLSLRVGYARQLDAYKRLLESP